MATMWSALDIKHSLETQLALEWTTYCFLIFGKHQHISFMTASSLFPSSAWKCCRTLIYPLGQGFYAQHGTHNRFLEMLLFNNFIQKRRNKKPSLHNPDWVFSGPLQVSEFAIALLDVLSGLCNQ